MIFLLALLSGIAWECYAQYGGALWLATAITPSVLLVGAFVARAISVRRWFRRRQVAITRYVNPGLYDSMDDAELERRIFGDVL